MASINYPQPVIDLIQELKRLPGIGPRSAERVALWLMQSPKAQPMVLAESLVAAKQEVSLCGDCGFFTTSAGCPVCSDHNRSRQLLCVVENATDVLPMERSGAFDGYYHCLGGKLSPLDGVMPEDLNIRALLRRVKGMSGVEVVLALGADVEGEATSNYLAEMLESLDCSVSRIAQGLPAGGGLEHADELTLTRALQGRRKF
ncbi:recombination mediator RecR [Persicirhabdus sediminis]|uniref:Recombination protein RecR n=1 Tax=Persicirhabdus sediminis TaxID=454144 RepID=A0A8J7SH04_9BACT|nr:recombination mediator RecR [Persicirhabdus sediminis]MBK1790470.1 recombination protein RecR [Persicirhabdus sediminis]